MEIGKFKHRIKIYTVENTINDEGGYEEMPTTIATPFCEVSKTTIKEFRNEDLDTRRNDSIHHSLSTTSRYTFGITCRV